MTENHDAFQLLDAAERAAAAGDFESTYELLRRALRRQEEDLGPFHPDLAKTLNNLGVVAERTGRAGEAEALYRRAVAIAEAALSPGDPMVAASRQNLEDFCRAHGTSRSDSSPLAAEGPAEAASPGANVPPLDALYDSEPTVPLPVTPQPQPPAALLQGSEPSPSARTSERPSHLVPVIAGGVVVLMVGAVLVSRPWSSRDRSPARTPETAVPAVPQSAPPAGAAPAAAPPLPVSGAAQVAPAKAAPPDGDRRVHAAESIASSGFAVETAELCRTFSTSGRTWRCDAAGDSAAPGRMVLYTRIRSARDGAVVHRWYHDGTLRQSVTLTIRANATEGYRTYSQQTVSAGAWRVEVRGNDGSLLHEQQFVVH